MEDTLGQITCVVMGSIMLWVGVHSLRNQEETWDKILGWSACILGSVFIPLGLAGLMGLIN